LTIYKTPKNWLDGIVITGGEPTIYADLPEFMAAIKETGFQIKLDTNGTNPSRLIELIKINWLIILLWILKPDSKKINIMKSLELKMIE